MMPIAAPTKTWSVSSRVIHCRLNEGGALRSCIKCSRSRVTQGTPRTSDAPPITKLTRLGIIVESSIA
jgi:hypothetical protein